MSMYSLLRSKAGAPSEQEIQENLAGNLWSVLLNKHKLVLQKT